MKKFLLLFLTFFYCSFGLSQDSCATAVAVTINTTYSVETLSGEGAPASCFENIGLNAAWYIFAPGVSGYYNITTDLAQNEGLDPRISVLSGNCNGDMNCVGSDDDSGDSYLSDLTVYLEEGNPYLIVWDNRWSSDGFDFLITEDFNATTPMFTRQTIETDGNFRMAAVDMNGDFLDDVVSLSDNFLNILFQQEDGSFTNETIYFSNLSNLPAWSLAIGDLNGDYYNDLLLGSGSGNSFLLSAEHGTAYTHYSSENYVFSQRTNMVDLNNDGILDAFSCHDVNPNVYYINDEDGNLTYHQGGMGDVANGGNYGSIFIDYDNDGDMDLYIAKCRGGNSEAKINEMHRNNGDGTYTEVAAEINMADPVQTWSTAWADFDNDGDMDAMVGANSFSDGGHKLMWNDGNGNFVDGTAGSVFEGYNHGGREFVAYDFDNNGWVDIFSSANNGTIFFNQGDGLFVATETAPSEGAIADLNNDGKLDIYKGSSIFYNTMNNEHNWIKVATLGTESNTNGIGARIEVHSNDGMRIREVRSGEGFSYMSSLNAHFGLGDDDTIDQVIIKWPSGIVDTYHDVNINETLYAVEGETLSTNEVDVNRNKLVLYPVPSSEFVTISSDIALLQKVSITSINGKTTHSLINNNRIPVKHLPTGIYFIQVSDIEGNIYNEKILVKH